MVYLISRFLIQSFSTLAQSVNRLKNINHLHSKILLKELFDKISLLKLLSQFPKFTNEYRVDIYSLNANQDTFNEIAKQEVNKVWTGLYGIEATNILLEDLSYDQESLELVRKLDSELVAMKYNTIEIEERRARNEALIAAANNEGNGNGMNMFMGMNLGQTLGGQLTQQAQNQSSGSKQWTSSSSKQWTKPQVRNFYIEVDGKYVLVTKDEEGNIVPVN